MLEKWEPGRLLSIAVHWRNISEIIMCDKCNCLGALVNLKQNDGFLLTPILMLQYFKEKAFHHMAKELSMKVWCTKIEGSDICDGQNPEPVFTGWSSVRWNTTGMPLVDSVYTGIPQGDPTNTCRVHWNTIEKISWNCPTVEFHSGETLTIAAYTGIPLEGL